MESLAENMSLALRAQAVRARIEFDQAQRYPAFFTEKYSEDAKAKFNYASKWAGFWHGEAMRVDDAG